jgi:heme oxygenase
MTQITNTDGKVEPVASFAAEIRQRSAQRHDDAEHSALMAALVKGELPLEDYARMVAQLYFVYGAIETAAGEMRDDPVAGPFIFDELTRLPALRADLQVLLGDDWRDEIEPLSATVGYVARVLHVTAQWPPLFLAHHYTRYMGDLSGGVFIGGAVRRAYNFTATSGAAFYEFEAIPSAKAFKEEYRRRLDAIPLDWEGRERFVSEVLRAYTCNTALMTELDEAFGGT